MNVKAVIPLVAGLGIAGLAGNLGLKYLRNAQASPAKNATVWVAANDIARGVSIQEPMLQSVNFPVDALPKGAFVEKSKLVGRVPRLTCPAGLPVLESMLTTPGTLPGVHVPPGYRAVAVKIDESSGVDNHLQPGCRVDVIGFLTRRAEGGKQQVFSRQLIDNVEVAAVGERISSDGPAATGAPGKDTKSGKPARAVTLLVKPEQVPILHMAEQRGKIKLSMRGIDGAPDDRGTDKIVAEKDLLGEAGRESGEGVGNFFAGLFASKPADNKNKFATRPPVLLAAPPQPEEPKPAWEMTLVNGDRKQKLGFRTMADTDPIELSSESGGGTTPRKPVAGTAAPKQRPLPPQALAPRNPPHSDEPTQANDDPESGGEPNEHGDEPESSSGGDGD